MRNMAMVLLLLAGVAFPLVNAYHIDPVNARQSGWALGDENHGVSQVLTINFDEPITASLFCGSRGDSGTYSVGIYSYPGGVARLAEKLNVDPPLDHHWLTCSLAVSYPDSFIKGRQVEVRWTRSGNDSVNYYYNYCATRYDSMAAAEELDSGPVELRIA